MIRPPVAIVTSLLLLLAAQAGAQVVSPIEQSYGPYTRAADGYEPALAVSRTGVLLAWSEVIGPGRLPQIRIGLLDFHGRLVSPITDIETKSGAASPSVTFDGTSFRVKYMDGGLLFAVDVDTSGTPIVAPRRWSLTAVDGKPILLWEEPHRTCTFARGCSWYPYWILHWSFAERSGTYFTRKTETVGPAVAGGSTNHFAMAWNGPAGVNYLEMRNGVQPAETSLIPASVSLWERPAVDCDDTHCLFAFATLSRQIYGVLIESAQPHLQVQVPIETATRVESPQVHLLQKGRFLVSYVSAADDPAHRFAGRIVTTAPLPRRRAAR